MDDARPFSNMSNKSKNGDVGQGANGHPHLPLKKDLERETTPPDLERLSYLLRITSHLCDDWATKVEMMMKENVTGSQPVNLTSDQRHLKAKGPRIWELIRAGIPSGEMEYVPHELVKEDYQLLYIAMKQVESKLGKRKTAERVCNALQGERIAFEVADGAAQLHLQFNPAAGTRNAVKRMITKRSGNVSDFAVALAGCRYGLPYETARSLVYRRKTKEQHRGEFILPQTLLACVLYDLCQSREPERVAAARSSVFNTLLNSDYSRFRLFYRIAESYRSANYVPAVVDPLDLTRLTDYVERLNKR